MNFEHDKAEEPAKSYRSLTSVAVPHLLIFLLLVTVTRCQVSSMSLIGEYLYVGTTFGCLVVIDPLAVAVVTVCRPYQSSELSCILPLTVPLTLDPPDSDVDPVFFDDPVLDAELGEMPGSVPHRSLLVTIGRGYSDLVGNVFARYRTPLLTASLPASDDAHRTAMIAWSGDEWRS